MTDKQPKLVRFSAGPLTHLEIGKPRRPIEGDTVFRSLTGFADDQGAPRPAFGKCTAGKFRSDTTGYIEFGYILEGECRIVDPDGPVHHLKVGDPFCDAGGLQRSLALTHAWLSREPHPVQKRLL